MALKDILDQLLEKLNGLFKKKEKPAASPSAPAAPKNASGDDSGEEGEDDLFFHGLPLPLPAPTTANMNDIHEYMFYNGERQILYVSAIIERMPEFYSFKEELQAIQKNLRVHILNHEEFTDAKRRFGQSRATAAAVAGVNSRYFLELQKLFKEAMAEDASDIHIDTFNGKADIRFRIGGVLTKWKEIPNGDELLRVIYNTVAEGSENTYMPTHMQNATLVDTNKMPQGMIGVRIVTAPHYAGNFMVMRLQKEASNADIKYSVSERLMRLGYTMHQARDWMRIMRKPSGVVIISGKVGSGKTKTLSVIAESMQKDNPGKLIQTVENPIEIPIVGVRQMSIKTGYGKSDEVSDDAFSEGINVALRSDPNILVISEVRTEKEAFAAFKGADTGHLLFTTIHANSALSSIPRFQSLLPHDSVPDPFLHMSDADFMNGVCYQRLVQILCNECKIPLAGNENLVPPDLLERIYGLVKRNREVYNGIYLRGPGCKNCNNRGYKGRTVLAEVIAFDNDLLSIYGRTHSITEVKIAWLKNGGISYRHVGVERLLAGMISPQEYEEHCGDIGTIEGIAD